MSLLIDWNDIALRLVLTVLACGVLGWERGEAHRAAGTRTTLIVGLAASVSMLQANMLLLTIGKTSDSFATADVLRLPLGILTGVGFIGAGAILRRDDRIVGLTTAATLWFVTVIGLLFGGGQLSLGVVSTLLALFILHTLKLLDRYRQTERQVRLHISWQLDKITEVDLRTILQESDLRISTWDVSYDMALQVADLRCTLKWKAKADNYAMPPALKSISQRPGIQHLAWSL